jgi:FPC/CPF motif-containing protein YcgG
MNPFDGTLALANSNYSTFEAGRLVRADDGRRPNPLTQFVHDGLRGLVLSDLFSCDGGKAALRRGTYAFGMYDALDSLGSAAGLARDLHTFATEMATAHDGFTTFIASFAGPHPTDERHFEELLWGSLQRLHDLDCDVHDWAPSASPDPGSPEFSFSFAGLPFFVIGLHAASSRAARRFAWPTLVFNPHRQFDDLRKAGRYARFQQVIRRAEIALQGSTNPMLSDFGAVSEARQYSGRRVDADWQCPFHAKSANGAAAD